MEITPPAQRDLMGIYAYIAETLKEHASAAGTYHAIKKEIQTLRSMPERYAVIDEPPYREMGMRTLPARNYLVFYLTNRENKAVTVLRILYNRREWRHLLSDTIANPTLIQAPQSHPTGAE